MRTTTLARTLAALAAGAAALSATAASAQGRWDWRPGAYQLVGPGVPILLPELRDTPRGHAFVLRNFDRNRDGIVQRWEADAANRAFLDAAGPNRGRWAWPDAGREVVVVDDRGPGGPGGWDRGAMRDYHFRQTPRGATMSLSGDVLFATDSAVLRPHAIDRLRPLAGYLRANPGVRVSIVGFTDSRGSDQHNQELSERRADSVRTAFDAMGVTRARFSVEGRGEQDPVATNATADGMRLNRRVEVTLLGQRASGFEG